MKRLIIFVSLILGVTALQAQDFLKKSKVSGNFQMDGNYYWADKGIGITEEDINGNEFGAYGFGKIQYQLGDFTAGMRFEAYQVTPMSGFDMRVDGMGIANYFATYDDSTIGVTVLGMASPSRDCTENSVSTGLATATMYLPLKREASCAASMASGTSTRASAQ